MYSFTMDNFTYENHNGYFYVWKFSKSDYKAGFKIFLTFWNCTLVTKNKIKPVHENQTNSQILKNVDRYNKKLLEKINAKTFKIFFNTVFEKGFQYFFYIFFIFQVKIWANNILSIQKLKNEKLIISSFFSTFSY